MKRLSFIFIVNFIFICTLHAGTTYFSPDGKVISKKLFKILQKDHAKEVQAAREKRKADALAKQASQKKINTDIPLDQFGRPIKTPDGRWITYPDQERHDIPQVTIVGHNDDTHPSAERNFEKRIEMEGRRLKEKLDYYQSDYKKIRSSKGHRNFGKAKEAQIKHKLKLLKDDPEYHFYVESTKQRATSNKNSDDPSSDKPPVPKVDPHTGTVFTPIGNDQYINTQTGSVNIHTGGNQFLDTQTGEMKTLP